MIIPYTDFVREIGSTVNQISHVKLSINFKKVSIATISR